MKRNVLIAAIAAALLSSAAFAHGGFGGGGMMGGHGMGAGPGACTNDGAIGALNLSAEQRDKIAAIRKDLSTQQLSLAASMRELRTQASLSGKPVDTATYDAMAKVRKQMFELTRDGRERIDAVLTPEQRAQWRPGWRAGGRGGMGGMGGMGG